MNPTETIQAPTLRSDQALQQALHRLWTDHAIWTREYVVAAIAQSPDAGAAANRLLRNQEDIGNAIVPLYGEAAGAAGRVADSRRPAATMRYDLKEAVEELAAGLDVTVEETEPFGCSLVL